MGEKSRAVLDAADMWLAALDAAREDPILAGRACRGRDEADRSGQGMAPRRPKRERLRLSGWVRGQRALATRDIREPVRVARLGEVDTATLIFKGDAAMALLDDVLNGGNFTTGLVVGAGALIAWPLLSPIARPLAKT